VVHHVTCGAVQSHKLHRSKVATDSRNTGFGSRGAPFPSPADVSCYATKIPSIVQ
jgi:hypothetical protein